MKKTKFKKNAQKISYKPDTCLNLGESTKWFSEFPWLHDNEQRDSVLCDLHATKFKIKSSICQKHRNSALFLKGFQTGNWRWRDSRRIKCL